MLHPITGRGATENPPCRFISTERVDVKSDGDDPDPAPSTQFIADASRTLITTHKSPDISFDTSINAYRGCEHGCIYCYARPTHEYFGFSAGLDFETKIMVKENAPTLLKKELSKGNPRVLTMSSVTDPYQPIERKLRLTRRCLEVLVSFRNPVIIITKNRSVIHDKDLLEKLVPYQAVAVFLSIPTCDESLSRVLEPRTSKPERRLEALSILSSAGIPTGVMVSPVIPGLTDHEVPLILKEAAKAGARFARMQTLRLPGAVLPLFESWLDTHRPRQAKKVLTRIRAMHGGRLNDPRFGARMTGEGVFAEQIESLFKISCKKVGMNQAPLPLTTRHFRVPTGQRDLFEDSVFGSS